MRDWRRADEIGRRRRKSKEVRENESRRKKRQGTVKGEGVDKRRESETSVKKAK